ncbi:unnamed protein product [marine sediment metagenome]|uniref:Homing endonuclease LAGLIDADG domain-containing protein n=1 Tax=marine sediment metagenome TaxID=412755 RepID=X1SWH3_9ZZZZ
MRISYIKSEEHMKEADKRELANFLDTEGFIGITCVKKQQRFIPTLILTNTEKGWLKGVKAKWGGTISPSKSQNPKWKETWQWHIHGDNLLYVLDMIKPYLKIKAKSCDLCRELQYRISHRIGVDHSNRLTPQEKDTRARLYRKCKRLTATGRKAEQLKMDEPIAQLSLGV